MNNKQIIIGLIHAKWCGHCRNLMPIWNQMRTNIDKKSYSPPPQYMVVEHSNLGELDRFNNENALYLNNQRVQHDGFPTIFKIKDGKIDYYKNSRDPNSLERWFMGNQNTSITYRVPIRYKIKNIKTKRNRTKIRHKKQNQKYKMRTLRNRNRL